MRSICLFGFVFYCISPFLWADPTVEKQVERTLARQQTMVRAKDFLHRSQPLQAVQALEAGLDDADGQAAYLELLQEAYVAAINYVQLQPNRQTELPSLRKKLARLRNENPGDLVTAIIEEDAVDVPIVEKKKPLAELNQVLSANETIANPLQKELPVQAKPGLSEEELQELKQLFEAKKYGEAAKRFLNWERSGKSLNAEQHKLWGYCKLHEIARQLNANEPTSLNVLEQETRQAIQLGNGKLDSFGEEILQVILSRKGSKEPDSQELTTWNTLVSANFTLHFKSDKSLVSKVQQLAEEIRTAMFERWGSGSAGTWNPKCAIWLHPDGECYAKSTNQSSACPSHSTVQIQAGKITSRRIDLHLDEKNWVDGSLPREITYVVLCDLFPEEPLPKWAETAMTLLSQSPAEVSRYLRMLPKLEAEKKWLPVAKLLRIPGEPEANSITAFQAQSISIVDFLVRQKGAKTFVLFLKEVPRRGYEVCLQRYYQFKDIADFESRWSRFAAGQ